MPVSLKIFTLSHFLSRQTENHFLAFKTDRKKLLSSIIKILTVMGYKGAGEGGQNLLRKLLFYV
jgi:hypothetical protein